MSIAVIKSLSQKQKQWYPCFHLIRLIDRPNPSSLVTCIGANALRIMYQSISYRYMLSYRNRVICRKSVSALIAAWLSSIQPDCSIRTLALRFMPGPREKISSRFRLFILAFRCCTPQWLTRYGNFSPCTLVGRDLSWCLFLFYSLMHKALFTGILSHYFWYVQDLVRNPVP